MDQAIRTLAVFVAPLPFYATAVHLAREALGRGPSPWMQALNALLAFSLAFSLQLLGAIMGTAGRAPMLLLAVLPGVLWLLGLARLTLFALDLVEAPRWLQTPVWVLALVGGAVSLLMPLPAAGGQSPYPPLVNTLAGAVPFLLALAAGLGLANGARRVPDPLARGRALAAAAGLALLAAAWAIIAAGPRGDAPGLTVSGPAWLLMFAGGVALYGAFAAPPWWQRLLLRSVDRASAASRPHPRRAPRQASSPGEGAA